MEQDTQNTQARKRARGVLIRHPLHECCDEIRILQGLIQDAKKRYWELRAKQQPLTWTEWMWYKLGWL